MEFMSGTRTRVRTETTPWRGAALVRTRGLALFVAERVNLNLEATGGSRVRAQRDAFAKPFFRSVSYAAHGSAARGAVLGSRLLSHALDSHAVRRMLRVISGTHQSGSPPGVSELALGSLRSVAVSVSLRIFKAITYR